MGRGCRAPSSLPTGSGDSHPFLPPSLGKGTDTHGHSSPPAAPCLRPRGGCTRFSWRHLGPQMHPKYIPAKASQTKSPAQPRRTGGPQAAMALSHFGHGDSQARLCSPLHLPCPAGLATRRKRSVCGPCVPPGTAISRMARLRAGGSLPRQSPAAAPPSLQLCPRFPHYTGVG